jgi:hypothetical protein
MKGDAIRTVDRQAGKIITTANPKQRPKLYTFSTLVFPCKIINATPGESFQQNGGRTHKHS